MRSQKLFKKVVLVTGTCATVPAVFHALPQVDAVVMEQSEPRWFFLKRRARKIGWTKVVDQLLFQLLVVPWLRRSSAGRIEEIRRMYNLKGGPLPQELLFQVPSINDEVARATLRSLQPDLVVVHGTRIISKATLQSVSCPWVNIHAGITPRYRGSHGAYWALYQDDAENCGVTLHLVDSGIDTGSVLAQAAIPRTPSDSYASYPWLQLGEGLRLLKDALEIWPAPVSIDGPSGLHYQPGLSEYLLGRLRGVR